ncbi:MAG: primosomal replication protein [Acidimicrobiaceae bacterium]|nr:primosomal replication protein [Acidimicrobiaceae bacterium]
MPASPIHHTSIDSTNAWDGPAAEKAFDKKAADFVKFYAWVDEGEGDPDADGTDKEDGWGPHHDIGDDGIPGDANEKGFEAAMAALNGAHGTTSVIPDGDRQAVWDHIAAHYKDAGVDEADIPALSRSHRHPHAPRRDDAPAALPSYEPIPYRVDPDEAVTCPHCQLKNDDDASFCDQCGTELVGRSDVTVMVPDPTIVPDEGEGTDADGSATVPMVAESYAPEPYNPQADETVQCPSCQKMNDPDARFCDQCGIALVGRPDVKVDGPAEDVDNVNRSRRSSRRAIPAAELAQCGVCMADNDPDAMFCDQCGQPIPDPTDQTEDAGEEGSASSLGADYENAGAGGRSRRATTEAPPRANLVRARPGAIALRDADPLAGDPTDTGSLMFGHFSVFNEWYEIDSWWEGQFLESIAPGAFKQTMVDDLANMRVLYDHGYDPELGNKPLGPITALREDDVGAYYEVPLLDTAYNRDFVLPVLQGRLMSGQQVGSQLGASFRFIVMAETWTQKPDPSDFNQLGLPQRVITQAQVLEFGPVTFPANQGASSGVRSGSDKFIHHLHHDPAFVARLTERVGHRNVERMLKTMPAADRAARRGRPAAPASPPRSPDRKPTPARSQRSRRAQVARVLDKETP